jgi:DNA-binding response OmpR family regulator
MHCDEHPGAILLVDDDDCIRKSVKQCLERAGYTVIVASDGDMGLACFKQNQGKISLLLTDVVMPNMNGLDLADRVLELDGALPVLFMSSSVNADRGNGCLAKPFRRSELIAKVGFVMQRRPLARRILQTGQILPS